MPDIKCELIGFNSSRPSLRQVPVTPLQLFVCAAKVGMPTLSSPTAATRPLLEMLWRIGMVSANVRPTADGSRWTRSDAYDRLDPSEKSAVSYFLGMTQAALMSRYALGYPHLVHLDRLLKQQGLPLKGKRPDFVAISPAQKNSVTPFGATFEAKGRTNGFDQAALDKAKEQAKLIPKIRGLAAVERVGAEGYFDEFDHWSAILADPDGEGIELELGLETYLLVYYRNIIEAGSQSGTWGQVDDHHQFLVPDLPIVLSIPSQLVNACEASANIPENKARDEAGLIIGTYRALVEAADDDDFDDFVTATMAPNHEESELVEFFGMPEAGPSA